MLSSVTSWSAGLPCGSMVDKGYYRRGSGPGGCPRGDSIQDLVGKGLSAFASHWPNLQMISAHFLNSKPSIVLGIQTATLEPSHIMLLMTQGLERLAGSSELASKGKSLISR